MKPSSMSPAGLELSSIGELEAQELKKIIDSSKIVTNLRLFIVSVYRTNVFELLIL